MLPGRSTFIDDIIQKDESQASVGPRKGSTQAPQAVDSPNASHIEVHSRTKGTKESFQSTHTPPFILLGEGNSCNLREGEGENSGVVEANPSPPPDPRSPMILIGEGTPEILDRGSAIKSPRGSSNQSP